MGKFIKDGITYEVTAVTPTKIYYTEKIMRVDGVISQEEFKAQKASGQIEVL